MAVVEAVPPSAELVGPGHLSGASGGAGCAGEVDAVEVEVEAEVGSHPLELDARGSQQLLEADDEGALG